METVMRRSTSDGVCQQEVTGLVAERALEKRDAARAAAEVCNYSPSVLSFCECNSPPRWTHGQGTG